MLGLFVALGIAILTLIAVLLWFVPHLLHQQSQQVAQESSQLREMIGEMISEHEAVAMRQVQLGTSISYLQDQLEQIITIHVSDEGEERYLLTTDDMNTLKALNEKINYLQVQLNQYADVTHVRTVRDSESWLYLLGIITAMQERLRTVSPDTPGLTHTTAPKSSNGIHGHSSGGGPKPEMTGHQCS